MTIRLLCDYENCPPNSIITLDAGTETGLVNSKQASFDLTGGTAFVPRSGALQTRILPFTVRARRALKVALAEGQSVTVSGSAGSSGKVDRLDSSDAVVQSWAIGVGTHSPIGPFSGDQKFLITCATGSVDATLSNSVLSTTRTSIANAARKFMGMGDSRSWGGQPYRAPGLFDGRPYYPASITAGGSAVNSAGWVVNVLIDGKAPGSSTGTLETDGTGQLRWTFSGDATPGPWVNMAKGGWAYLSSGTSAFGLHVSVRGGTAPPASPGSATVSAGVSIAQLNEYNTLGYFSWLAGALGETFSDYHSYSISGATSTDVLKFADQALAADYEAGSLLINVNDFSSVTTVAQGQAAATLAVTNNKAIIDKMRAKLRYTYVIEDFPYPGGNSILSKYQALASQLIREYCAGFSNVRFVSANDKMVDPNASSIAGRTGVFYDGLHLQPYGAMVAALPVVAAVKMDYPATALRRSNYNTYDSVLGVGTWNANPGLRGTAGAVTANSGITGTVPDSYTLARSGTTQTCTTRFAADIPADGTTPGPDWWCMAVAGATAGDRHELSVTVNVPAEFVGTSTSFQFVAEWKVLSASGTGIDVFAMQANSNSNIQSDYVIQTNSGRGLANFASEGPPQRHKGEPQVLQSGVTNFTLKIRIGAAAGGGAGEIGFRLLRIEKATP